MTLGEFLRQEREKQGITLEQVASATKISIRILHSLEADQFAELPAKPFIRGFVIAYCRFIGLDPKETLSQFDQFIDEKVILRPQRDSGHNGYAFEKKDVEQQNRTVLLLAMCGFLVVGGLAVLIFKPSLHHRRKSHLEKLQGENAVAHIVAASVQPAEVQSGAALIPSYRANQSSFDAVMPLATSSSIMVTPTPTSSLASSQAVHTVATPSPEKISASTPLAQPLPEVSPSATPSPVASKLAARSVAAAVDPADPLDSGLTLKKDEIHHRAVFHVLEDVWVRYQVDQRAIRKFVIRKGHSLVLRAKDQMIFQTSRPDFIVVSYNHGGSKPLLRGKKVTLKGGNLAFVFPEEMAETIEKPSPFVEMFSEVPLSVGDQTSQH